MKPTRVLGPLAAATVIAVGVFALQRTYTMPRGAYRTNTSHQLSWYDATYFCCTNFTGLTKGAKVVVVSRVTKALPSYVVPNDPPVVVTAPPPHLTGPKATMIANAPTPLPNATPAVHMDDGTVMTDFTIEVLAVLRGTGIQLGQQLTVAQTGGTDGQGNQVLMQGDPLLRVGDQEILFLQQSPVNGKYYTVGGPQGRFAVSAAGTVQPKDPEEFAYTAAYSGKTVQDLTAAIQAIN